MPPAIRVENLGKSYLVGRSAASRGYRTLRESLIDAAKAPIRRLRRRDETPRDEEFWALKGVDFEVQPGEVVGIIGRNGAGKSTLLKILSRITKPTTGRVEMRGRVASLLEVGTGFHPELTGRENIFLNGSILGMNRREISRRFDDIVAFAEVERFLDTPVKRYSSGMYVRLAFAVAAHLEPEILIVDEVLAVGDVSFQKKCLGKMNDVAHSGRTVFFVSHQLESVRRLCTTVTWLEQGRVEARGNKEDVIVRYLAKSEVETPAGFLIDLSSSIRVGNGNARFEAFVMGSGCESTADQPYPDGPLDLILTVASDADRDISSLAVTFRDRSGTKLVNADTLELGREVQLSKGSNKIKFYIDELHLKPGVYSIGLWMAQRGEVLDHIENATWVEVVAPPTQGFGGRPQCDGVVTCNFRFK